MAVDTRALRDSRDFRLLEIGSLVTGLGTQAGLVALPYQVYVITRSPVLVGLIGLAELGPLVAFSLLGGAIADRMDRRTLLLLTQIALVAGGVAASRRRLPGLAAGMAALRARRAGRGVAAVERVARSALVPNVVAPEQLRSALSFSFGLYQLTAVVGPARGRRPDRRARRGRRLHGGRRQLRGDGARRRGHVAPASDAPRRHEPIFASIADGTALRAARRGDMGSFVIDIIAMTFGMPRALFPALSLTVYHAGASGTGFLFAAVSAGATVAALTTGWLPRARRLGRIVIAAVAVWGAAIAVAGSRPRCGWR